MAQPVVHFEIIGKDPDRLRRCCGDLFGWSEYNDRLKAAAPLLEAALRWLADHTPARRNCCG